MSSGRYVPPHLRGRGGNSSDSGSRWKNLGSESSGGKDRSGSHNSTRYGGRNNHNNHNKNNHYNNNNNSSNRSGTGSGISRWANVDRSAIAAGNHSNFRSHRTNNNNNNFHGSNNTNNRTHNRRFHRNASAEENHHLRHARAVFFGDSFIKLFGLLNEYSDSIPSTPRPIEVQKYKAASAKGLSRDGNENRDKIIRTVEAIRRQRDSGDVPCHNNPSGRPYQNLERLVFCFGSVDVHLSYYYKKYVQDQPLSDDDLMAIATGYVDFVAGLETTTTATEGNARPLDKLIVGIYPSPLCDKDVGASLLAYGSLESEEQVLAVDASEDRSIETRQARVDLFNRALRERCEYHNQHHEGGGESSGASSGNGRLEYWDVRDDLLTRGDDGRPRVRDAYKDVSDLNIHLIHETTLQLWVQKWSWYEALTTTAGGSGKNNDKTGAGFLEYLQKTFDEYRKTKPWAERTHVAETRGIRLSL